MRPWMINWLFRAVILILFLYLLQSSLILYLSKNNAHVLLLRLVNDPAWPAIQNNSPTQIEQFLYDANSWRNQGFLLAATGLHDEAVVSYQKALEESPIDILASYFLGIEQLELYREADAIQTWQQIPPEQIISAICHKVEMSVDERDFEQVIMWADLLLLMGPNDFNAHYCFGRGYIAIGELEAAVAAFENASHIGTTDIRSLRDVYRQKGDIYMDLSEWEKAVVAYRKAVELLPESANLRAYLGLALTHAGNYNEAEQELLQAIAVNPQLLRPYRYLSSLFEQQGDYEQAAYWHYRAHQAVPASSSPLRDLGILTLRYQEEPERAQQYLQQAVVIEPNIRANWLWLARTYSSLEQWDEMEEAYHQAAELSDSLGSRVRVLVELAKEFQAQGLDDRSLTVWYHILEIEPANEEARLMIQAIEARQQHDE